MKYLITEKQNLNSHRQGDIIEAKNLNAAKIQASKRQSFEGTVLQISTTDGILLSTKTTNWIDEND